MSTAQFELVRQEIHYAYERVAFFHKHMERSGLSPADIRTPDDFARLPTTKKADYRQNFPAGVLASGYTLRSRHVLRFQSSGTEGERLLSAILSYDLARRQATCLEVNPRFKSLWQPGLRLRTCRYAAPNCSEVECSVPGSAMSDRMLSDGTLVLPVYHDLLTTPVSLVEQAVDEIAQYDPHFLVVDPTHFAFLARKMKQAGKELDKRQGFCVTSGYTLCTRVARRQIREWLGDGVPVADMLGMSELGYIGFECEVGQLHLNTRNYFMEFICGDRSAEPGELAELVVTTLDDRLSPKIRYATGDLYRYVGSGVCSCGSALPVVTMEGRAKNMLWRHDDTILTPGELDAIVGPAPWLDLYRMEQTGSDEFVFQFIRNESATGALEQALADRLREALDTRNLRFEAARYFPSDAGGKFISCLSSVARQRLEGGI